MTSTYIQIQCTTSCHAGQLWYAYTVTQDSNNQEPSIAQMAARKRRRQGAANIRSRGLYFASTHQMAPPGTHPEIRPATHLSTPEGWKA